MKKNIKIILAVLLVAIIAGAFLLKPAPKLDLTKEPAEVQINATNIYRSFSDNEEKANALYAGKVIEVSGVLQAVEEDETGQFQLTLDTENQMGNVVCTLAKTNANTLDDLQIGKSISVKGVCTGFLFDVVIDHAILLPPTKSK